MKMTFRQMVMALIAAGAAFSNKVFAAPIRPNATVTFAPQDMHRFYDVINTWGGNSTTTEPVNWGMLLYNLIGVYPDAIGQMAYVIIFAIPFVMMWIVQADMTLPAIVGILFSFYILLKVPDTFGLFAAGCFAIAMTALVWSLMKRF